MDGGNADNAGAIIGPAAEGSLFQAIILTIETLTAALTLPAGAV